MRNPIRIAHVITDLNTGGAEMMLYRLMAEMDQAEYVSYVISVTGDGPIGDKIRSLGVPVTVLGMKSVAGGLAAVFQLARWLRQHPVDVIQTWMYHADLVGSLASRLAGRIPLVWGLHNSVLDAKTSKHTTRWTVSTLARLSHSLPNKILSCSQIASDLHIHLGYDASRMALIPNGFDLTDFHSDPVVRNKVRQEIGITEETLLIGHVGRFDPQKDYLNLVRAAAELLKKLPHVHFLLCGDGITWQNESLKGWIEALQLSHAFHLSGRRDDVPQLMTSFDLLTTSSAYGEAFPLVVGEAMACEVPCVVTNLGDSAYLVGNTGRVAPPRDPGALAAAWLDILSLSVSDRAVLGAAARQRIETHFSLPAVAEQYAALYRELAAAGGR